MTRRHFKDYSTLRQQPPSEKEGRGFFETLNAIRAPNKQRQEEKQIEFAADYAARLYGIDKAQFIIPEQGEQTFTFIANDRVIRLARHPGVSEIMANEVSVMRTLHGQTHFQTPSVLDFQPDKHIMAISRLPGESLSKERFESLPRETQELILKGMGQFLGEMHSLFPTTDKIEKPWWQESLLEIIEAHIEKESNPDKRERLQKVAEYTNKYGKNSEEPFVMLHGDLHAGNVIYDEKTGALGFIDFTSAKHGAAHRDLFKLRRGLPEDLFNIVVSAYEETTKKRINQRDVDAALDGFCVFTENPLTERVGENGYEEMSANNLSFFLQKITNIHEKYPDASFVGGAALRLLCLNKKIPIPRTYGGDVDISRAGIEKTHHDKTPDGEWIDIFPQKLASEPPFYEDIVVGGAFLKVASAPHLLVRKALSIAEGFEERGNVMEKDVVYFDLLKRITTLGERKAFGEEVSRIGHNIDAILNAAENVIQKAARYNLITTAVHPEQAGKGNPSRPIAKNRGVNLRAFTRS